MPLLSALQRVQPRQYQSFLKIYIINIIIMGCERFLHVLHAAILPTLESDVSTWQYSSLESISALKIFIIGFASFVLKVNKIQPTIFFLNWDHLLYCADWRQGYKTITPKSPTLLFWDVILFLCVRYSALVLIFLFPIIKKLKLTSNKYVISW